MGRASAGAFGGAADAVVAESGEGTVAFAGLFAAGLFAAPGFVPEGFAPGRVAGFDPGRVSGFAVGAFRAAPPPVFGRAEADEGATARSSWGSGVRGVIGGSPAPA
ncbi:hypothetical protein H4J02_01940 [Protaetiibacter sp. SSC-01]|uniref:hypothetical protein n=1 Tax=Protaetiibacter sp. SSC-01 TaxID=2759943 RepID=UPI001656C782|nr:hypothetical protein [Protaetiibacter sp. SSC-01]QNO37828.1 hypothetical protein H4J02_01940 [Protaetiibacter sp. SSC-01]